MNLGNSLFQARKKCGLSQEEVAEKLGVSRQTVSKWETDETVERFISVDALSKIWLRLLKICMPAIQEKPQSVNRAADKVKRMMIYIHEHYSEKIFVSELAQDAFISERECYRVFQEYLHMTPVEYIKSYRIQTACQMLADSQTPITEIASDCGWGNASYFGKIFRETTGYTPLQYRRKWQNSEKIWQDNIIS